MGLKKAMTAAREDRRQWIAPEQGYVSVTRQCPLADLPRSSFYHVPLPMESAANCALMKQIDRLYLKRPFYGSPRIIGWRV